MHVKDMKTLHYLYLLLICCNIALISCEKATDHTVNSKITFRDGDLCEDCATLEDCCCGIELQDQVLGSASLRLCGNDDGSTTCVVTPPSPCGGINGGSIVKNLDSSDPKLGFCMEPGGYFRIQNNDQLNNAVIKITCHYDIVNP